MAMRRAGNREQGVVLLMVVVYLQVFMLFSIAALERIDRDMRKNVVGYQLQDLSGRAVHLLGVLEQSGSRRCEVSPLSPVVLRSLAMAWWRQVSCHGRNGNFDYYYIREEMASGDKTPKKQTVKHYVNSTIYRNTLLYVSAISESRSALFQSVTYVADNGKTSRVKRLSLRRLW